MKTARKTSVNVLGLEHPDIRALNFTPGVVKTDMYETVRRHWVLGSELENWKTFQPNQSVQVLVQIIKENSFENCTQIHILDAIET